MLNTPFSPWPCFTEEEADVARDVILSNRVSYWTGDHGRLFEKEFAEWVGCSHAVALANGTVAIDVALKALNIGAGDEVVVTPRTFLASVSSIINSGATPVFADVDPNSQNITAETIRKVITTKTRGIICVHLAGWPCDMDPIMELAGQYNLKVIEDCAQAHGARYKGRSVGNIGHIGAWSFCQDKIMTTCGEGGMVTTNDPDLWSTMWSYKDHGKSWEAVYHKAHPPGYGFRWLHDSFGTNWRMIEIQAAIGRIQLKRMSEWQTARLSNARRIWATAAEFTALHVPSIPDYITHAAYKCYIFVKPEHLTKGWSRDRIMDEINSLGVPCIAGSCSEVYLEKAFDNKKFKPKIRLSVAKNLGENSLMFLVHPTLLDAEIEKTCDSIRQVMSKANRT